MSMLLRRRETGARTVMCDGCKFAGGTSFEMHDEDPIPRSLVV